MVRLRKSSWQRKPWHTLVSIGLIILLSAWLAFTLHLQITGEQLSTFNQRASLSVQRLSERLNDYEDIVYGGNAFLQNSVTVTQTEWNDFFRDLGLYDRYDAVSSVSYVKRIDDADKATFVTEMRRQPQFGPTFTIKPEGERSEYGVATLYASKNDLSAAIGSDLFEDPIRKAIYDSAARTGQPAASPPLILKSNYRGMFIVLPRLIDQRVDGYVLVSFRVDSLIKNNLDRELAGLEYRLTDVSETPAAEIYQSPDWKPYSTGPQYVSSVLFGNRTWRAEVAVDRWTPAWITSYIAPGMVLLLGIILCWMLISREPGLLRK